MSWYSGIPKIGNKDTEPDSSWDNIFNSVLAIFSKDYTNLPPDLRGKTKKEINRKVQYLITDIKNNKKELEGIDCDSNADILIKLLRPGRTTTILVDKKEVEYLKNKYNGEKVGPYVSIKLKYVDEQGRNPSFRLFPIEDYEYLLDIIKNFKSDSSYYELVSEILVKIELAAFCKGGDRRARWMLDVVHSEHGDKEECHKVAAKLTYFFLDILIRDLENKGILDNKTNKIKKTKEACRLLFDNKEVEFVEKIYPKAICPLCLGNINIIDFFRNGRNDPFSIVFGHYEFRGDKTKSVHLGKNAFWIHRTCNYIQGEYPIKERIDFLKNVLDNHKKYSIDWDKRG